jgi:hypothetical protein
MARDLGVFSRGRVHESIPGVAACGAAPTVDNLLGRQVGGSRRRGDDMAAGRTGIGSLRRRATVLFVSDPGCPAAFELSMKMQGIDEGVHGTAPAVWREHHCLSVTGADVRSGDTQDMVSGNEIDRPDRRSGHDAGDFARRRCPRVLRFDFGTLQASSGLSCQQFRARGCTRSPP